jgi:hypothetical protein
MEDDKTKLNAMAEEIAKAEALAKAEAKARAKEIARAKAMAEEIAKAEEQARAGAKARAEEIAKEWQDGQRIILERVAQARAEEEARAQEIAALEEKARAMMEEIAKAELEAEEKYKQKAEKQAEAENILKQWQDEQQNVLERIARSKADERAMAEEIRKAEEEARSIVQGITSSGREQKAEKEAQEKARIEAETAKAEAEEKARIEAEKAAQEKKAAEERARITAEKEAKEKARAEADKEAGEKIGVAGQAMGMTTVAATTKGITPPHDNPIPIMQAATGEKAGAKTDKEAKKKAKAEAKARAKADKEAKKKAKAEEKARAKADKEAAKKAEVEEKARAQADREAEKRAEAEAKARAQADREAAKKAEAEEKARAQADREAEKRAEAEVKARAQSDKEAEKKAEAQEKAGATVEKEAAEKAKAEAAKAEAEEKAGIEAEKAAKEKARAEAEKAGVIAEMEAEEKAKAVVETKAEAAPGKSRKLGLRGLKKPILPNLQVGGAKVGKNIIALSIDGGELRLVSFSKDSVESWDSVPFDPQFLRMGQVADPEGLGNVIKGALEGREASKSRIVCSPPGLRIVSRIINLPNVNTKELDSIVPREVRRLMTVSEEDNQIYWQALPSETSQTPVLVLAVAKEALNNFMETLRIGGVRPHRIDLKPMALMRAVNQQDAIIANGESNSVELVIVINDVPVQIRSIFLGEGVVTQDYAVGRISDELVRTITTYNEINSENPLDPEVPIFLCGAMAANVSFAMNVAALTGRSVQPLEPPLRCPEDFPLAHFMVNVGLILKTI